MSLFEVQTHLLADDGTIPNSVLPLLDITTEDSAEAFERLFHGNGWDRSWRNGIFAYRHYHSTAHEVLGIATGSAGVEFGGPLGVALDVAAGDAVRIPAGVSHFNLGASSDLLVIGAYPPGPDYNLRRDNPAEYETALAEVARVPRPATDPVTGSDGGCTSTGARDVSRLRKRDSCTFQRLVDYAL